MNQATPRAKICDLIIGCGLPVFPNSDELIFVHMSLLIFTFSNYRFQSFAVAKGKPRNAKYANFFSEWMYDCSSPTWFEADLARFPSEDEASSFIAAYLGAEATQSKVASLLGQVEDRIPDVHRRWIEWSCTSFPDRKVRVLYPAFL